MSTLLDNSMFIRVSKSRAGNNRKADKAGIETDADKDMITLGKKLFDCDEYKAIITFDGSLDMWLKLRCIAVGNIEFRGMYILPLSLLTEVDEYMRKKKEERKVLVEKFLQVYDAQREQGRERLKSMFKEEDYPPVEEVRGKFDMSWRYVEFGVSKKLPPEMLEKEQKELEEQFKNMEVECRDALRQTCIKLCSHLSESLTPNEDGSKKKFYDSNIENLVQFLDLFAKRDITNDTEMRELCAKAKGIVSAATPEALRKDDDMRKIIKEAMDKVTDRVVTMVETEKRRKFDL